MSIIKVRKNPLDETGVEHPAIQPGTPGSIRAVLQLAGNFKGNTVSVYRSLDGVNFNQLLGPDMATPVTFTEAGQIDIFSGSDVLELRCDDVDTSHTIIAKMW